MTMATYFTTRRFDDVDASEVHVGDRIIRLIEAYDFPGSGPSDKRVFDVAVEGDWTGERMDQETRYPASDLPSFTSEDGATVVVVNHQIGLTWPVLTLVPCRCSSILTGRAVITA